jgi:hypothetical protein
MRRDTVETPLSEGRILWACMIRHHPPESNWWISAKDRQWPRLGTSYDAPGEGPVPEGIRKKRPFQEVAGLGQ